MSQHLVVQYWLPEKTPFLGTLSECGSVQELPLGSRLRCRVTRKARLWKFFLVLSSTNMRPQRKLSSLYNEFKHKKFPPSYES